MKLIKLRSTDMTFDTVWTLNLALAAVEDGGVVFKDIGHNASAKGWQEGNLSWHDSAETVADRFRDGLNGQLGRTFSSKEWNLLNALRNQHRLFLPGKGSFLMKDPKFNKRGDLMVQLDYNGYDALSILQPSFETAEASSDLCTGPIHRHRRGDDPFFLEMVCKRVTWVVLALSTNWPIIVTWERTSRNRVLVFSKTRNEALGE